MGRLAIDLAEPFLRSHPTLSSGRIDLGSAELVEIGMRWKLGVRTLLCNRKLRSLDASYHKRNLRENVAPIAGR